jgi:plastocyanin
VIRALLLVAAAVLLAACPGPRPEDAAENAPLRPAGTTAAPPAAPAVAEVQLLEYEIRMADTLAAGPQRLRIANAGKERHSLAIEGPDVSAQLAGDLTGGDTHELSVTLKPGTYTVWCPVDTHRGKGMQRTLTVK